MIQERGRGQRIKILAKNGLLVQRKHPFFFFAFLFALRTTFLCTIAFANASWSGAPRLVHGKARAFSTKLAASAENPSTKKCSKHRCKTQVVQSAEVPTMTAMLWKTYMGCAKHWSPLKVCLVLSVIWKVASKKPKETQSILLETYCKTTNQRFLSHPVPKSMVFIHAAGSFR